MNVDVVGAGEIARMLTMEAAIDALEAAFGDALPEAPGRTHLGVPGGELLLMPAAGTDGVGVKLVTVNPDNPPRGRPLVQAAYVLFDPETLAPVALLDGTALTALRTGAVSGLATRHLARADARTLVLFGAGVQAGAHLRAMMAVRPVERVLVVSRTTERAEELAGRARAAGAEASVADPTAVAEADIVCTCTTSAEPVLHGASLPKGVHVNAVGAYRPDTRELDDEAVARARVVVETRAAALAEKGDLLIPMAAGRVSRDAIVADLAEVVRGAPVRRTPEDVTLFASVGVAFEDLVVATAVTARRGSSE